MDLVESKDHENLGLFEEHTVALDTFMEKDRLE